MQNWEKTDRATDDYDDEDDEVDEDEEMPDVTGRPAYETCKRDGRYIPIQTNPEDDALQIRTDGETSG